MKTVIILSLLLLASPVFGELTKEDLRTIIKEENAALEKRVKEYIDIKIDGLDNKLSAQIDAVHTRIDGLDSRMNIRIDAVDKSLGRVWLMIAALIGLIAATITIPQIIIYRDRGQKNMQTQIDQLREQIEAMQNTPS